MIMTEFVFDSGESKLLEFYRVPESSDEGKLSYTKARNMPTDSELLKEWT